MTEAIHPNMSLLMKLDIRNLDSCNSVFAEDFTWHYFNPRLTELEGDYHGIEGLKSLFAKLANKSNSSFQVNVVDARPVGDELVVTHVCNRMTLEGNTIEFDAVVIWRIVNDKFTEAWDIPAVNTVRSINDAEYRW